MTLALFQMSSVPPRHEELDPQEAAIPDSAQTPYDPAQTPYDVPMSPDFEFPALSQHIPTDSELRLVDYAIWDIVVGEDQPVVATTPRSVSPTVGYMPLSPRLDLFHPDLYGSPPDLQMELDPPSVPVLDEDSAESHGALARRSVQSERLSGASEEHVPPLSPRLAPGPDAPNQAAPAPEVPDPDVQMPDASGEVESASNVGGTTQQTPSLHWLSRVKRVFPPKG